MNADFQTVLHVSKALADETRLKLLALLLDHDLCGKALANRLGISEAAVSQHLKILKTAGLVTAEKRGYWTHYGIERRTLAEAAKALEGIAGRSAFPGSPCRRLSHTNQLSSKRADRTMCCQSCCERPEQLKERPETCSPEQIIKCHGDVGNHPCTEKKKTGKP
ncbi:MAG: metalloregulator ArsR/SmtB family transcription factor [Desulfobacterales bacterium]|jgi:DNA-binding transcriptional ArsR family regulator|nr:metalloregulator ArsR/SmtB family transcription factor [Desulfobacterales bacterium]